MYCLTILMDAVLLIYYLLLFFNLLLIVTNWYSLQLLPYEPQTLRQFLLKVSLEDLQFVCSVCLLLLLYHPLPLLHPIIDTVISERGFPRLTLSSSLFWYSNLVISFFRFSTWSNKRPSIIGECVVRVSFSLSYVIVWVPWNSSSLCCSFPLTSSTPPADIFDFSPPPLYYAY